jgi:hypothetical protein
MQGRRKGGPWDGIGQTGSDLGPRYLGNLRGARGDAACAMRESGRLTFPKVQVDLSKILKASNGSPEQFRLVTRSAVSAKMRGKIKDNVLSCGPFNCDIWSGAKFEEFLRRDAELSIEAIH